MSEWYSKDSLQKAWRYAKIDSRDDFVFDIINHQDVHQNIDKVLDTLAAQLRDGQWHPAPVHQIAVPKNDYSTRPGTTIALVDLIVLYAIAQQLAPALDKLLSASAYAYRLNPKSEKSRQPLFKDKEAPVSAKEAVEEIKPEDEEQDEDAEFPSDWFSNWKLFQETILTAAETYDYVAITDITAFFENISQTILFDRIRELLGSDYRDLTTRLVTLMQSWNWSFGDDKGGERGLPQGNDVSSFLANVYLLDLDKAMLEVVNGDTTKYARYVDDVQLHTSNREEAQQALIVLERVLRTLCLNVQSAKTEIKPSNEAFDQDVLDWLNALSNESEDRLNCARQFIQEIFDPNDPASLSKWDRVYRRCLTVLARARDDMAVEIARSLFLTQPNSRLVRKHFAYLKEFVATVSYEEAIYRRLIEDTFTFDFHRAYMYRLAAYSRGVHEQLRQLAFQHAMDSNQHWLCRVAALFSLSTHALTGQELAEIGRLLNSEGNPQVIRAAFVVLCQHARQELDVILDQLAFFNAPHQEYLKRYMLQLTRAQQVAQQRLSVIEDASIQAPVFVHHLHALDLIKANGQVRAEFNAVIGQKVQDCEDNWPRLCLRLQSIRSSFIENP